MQIPSTRGRLDMCYWCQWRLIKQNQAFSRSRSRSRFNQVCLFINFWVLTLIMPRVKPLRGFVNQTFGSAMAGKVEVRLGHPNKEKKLLFIQCHSELYQKVKSLTMFFEGSEQNGLGFSFSPYDACKENYINPRKSSSLLGNNNKTTDSSRRRPVLFSQQKPFHRRLAECILSILNIALIIVQISTWTQLA